MQIPVLPAIFVCTLSLNTANANAQLGDFVSQPSPLVSPSSMLIASRSTEILRNGTNITDPQGARGRGTLRVMNGTANDAVVKLVERSSGTTRRTIYIRAGNSVTIDEIGSCDCVLKFTTGRQWDQVSHSFLQSPSYFQFRERLNFSEVRKGSQIRWANYTVTLHPVLGGCVRLTPIRRSDF